MSDEIKSILTKIKQRGLYRLASHQQYTWFWDKLYGEELTANEVKAVCSLMRTEIQQVNISGRTERFYVDVSDYLEWKRVEMGDWFEEFIGLVAEYSVNQKL